MSNHLFEIAHYTPSTFKKNTSATINAGISNDNIKTIKLDTQYKNPKFYPRKFKNWPDTFETKLVDGDLLIRRTDVSVGGWGEQLLIDVEYDSDDREISPSTQRIPRVIYQTFESHNVPEGMYNAVNSWVHLNTDYEHYFFDEIQRIEFIKTYFDDIVLDSYMRLLPGAFKADLWRCCVLYVKGGVYVDADMICLQSLSNVIDDDDSFIVVRDDPMSKKFLANGFIASVPNHPFLKKQIDNIVDNVQHLKDIYYLDVSGPALFGKSVNQVCELPVDTEFLLGKQTLNDYDVKILLHDYISKSFKYNNTDILITEYSNKLEEMSNLQNETFYSMYQRGALYQMIPFNIYFTSQDELGIHTYMYNSFKEKNSHWKLLYFNDDDCFNFLLEHRQIFIDELNVDVFRYYTTLKNGGEKSDLWRYSVVYLNGGVYTDTDTFCNVPLSAWVSHHDLVLGLEANLPIEEARPFGMDLIGIEVDNNIVSVCNWTFAAAPKHPFLKELIIDIVNNPIKNNVLLNTGPGRLTKHALTYFGKHDFSADVHKDKSVLFSINRFGANQSHSGSIKNYSNPMVIDNSEVYVIHLFDGTWRRTANHKIKKIKSNLGVSHNLTLYKTEEGFTGVARLDTDTSRTIFMEKIGDCRSLVEYKFDKNLTLISETERDIIGYDTVSKFEDYRHFRYNGENYYSVSYVDTEFNTRVAILDNNYKFLGNVDIDNYNLVSWIGQNKIWEKNWLFFEVAGELYFIYSTTPRYILYKCKNFSSLRFEKVIDIEWPFNENVPSHEEYFTAYIGSTIKIATGGSSNPIYLKELNSYLYFIHTKIYNEKKYNHYAVLLNENLLPVKFLQEPVINKFVPEELMFVSSVLEGEDHFIISGGVFDNSNFIWELSKNQILYHLKHQ